MTVYTQLATVEDLEERWRKLTEREKGSAKALLKDASAQICSLLGNREFDDILIRNCKSVACRAVKRAMRERDDLFGASQGSPDAQIWPEAVPNGDVYLTTQEREMLGVGSRVGTMGL